MTKQKNCTQSTNGRRKRNIIHQLLEQYSECQRYPGGSEKFSEKNDEGNDGSGDE